jgi:ELWxxDGT repeat protein
MSRSRSHPALAEALERRRLLTTVQPILPIAGVTQGSSPVNFTAINGQIVFGTHTAYSLDLWATNGTPTGTVHLAPIPFSSDIVPPNPQFGQFISYHGFVYLQAPTGGLWRTDGTVSGTVQVHPAGTSGAELIPELVFNDRLYFVDGTSDALYAYDGQTATLLGPDASAILASGPSLYFIGYTSAGGTQAYHVDPGGLSSSPLTSFTGAYSPNLVAPVGTAGRMLFVHYDASTSANDLFATDGTVSTTASLGKFSSNTVLVSVGSVDYYFAKGSVANTWALSRTDGTVAGTVAVTTLTGTASATPANLTAFAGKLYFTFATAASGTELWASDGTAAGTKMVADVEPGTASSAPASLTVVGSSLFFQDTDYGGKFGWWRTDGTAAGTVFDGRTAPPDAPVAANGKAIYAGNDPADGGEPFATDNTAAGTTVLANTNPTPPTAAMPVDAGFVWAAGSADYFDGDAPGIGVGLWRTDGTSGGTYPIVQSNGAAAPAFANSYPGTSAAVAADGRIYYVGGNSFAAFLWVSDGTPAGTRQVVSVGRADQFGGMGVGGNLAYFVSTGTGTTVWRSDGTAAGTFSLGVSSGTSFAPGRMFGGYYYFVANAELYRTDGTASGTTAVTAATAVIAATTSALYFTSGGRLWRTDGTTGGTVAVTAVVAQLDGATPLGGKLVFVTEPLTYSADARTQAFVDDPTVAGGPQLLATLDYKEYLTAYMATAGSRAYIVYDGNFWSTDGTAAGTGKVAPDLLAAASSTLPNRPLLADQGQLYFLSQSTSGTSALWRTDGTTSGTVLLSGSPTGTSSTTQVPEAPLPGSTPGILTLDVDPTDAAAMAGGSAVTPFLARLTTTAPLGSLTGRVFDDVNADGLYNGADQPVLGRSVYLDLNNNGVADPGEPSAATDGTGTYTFPALSDGTYVVRTTVVAGRSATVPSSSARTIVIAGGAAVRGVDFGSSLTPPAAFNVPAGQTVHLAADAGPGVSVRTATGVTVGAAGTLVVDPSPDSANRQLLSVGAGGLTLAGTAGAWTGLVDLGNNDLDVAGGSLATVTDQVKQAYAGGTWSGIGGITSTAAAGDAGHLRAVGVMANGSVYTNFDGQSVGPTDVLVKYTFYGDTNLDGRVDAADYTRIDAGFIGHLTGWANGDVNYDGVVDGSDYTLMDNAFNQQAPTAAAAVAARPVVTPTDGSDPAPVLTTSAAAAVLAAAKSARRATAPDVLPPVSLPQPSTATSTTDDRRGSLASQLLDLLK